MTSINAFCPRSGKPVAADSLTEYRGFTVGFCNPGCRDDFAAANPADCPDDARYFDAVIKERGLWGPFEITNKSSVQLDNKTALILIDIQKAFDHPKWGQRNNPDAEGQAVVLLRAWRETARPIVHVRHLNRSDGSLFHPDATTSQHKEIAQPVAGELVITKEVNSAFIGTNLERFLRDHGYNSVVICGLTTPHCVSTTTRMAGNLGFRTYVVADATAAFALTGPDSQTYSAEEVHRTALTTLHEEFATVLNTEQVLIAAKELAR